MRLGRTSRRHRFPKLYARTLSCSRISFARNRWHDSRVQCVACLPSLLHGSAVPRLLQTARGRGVSQELGKTVPLPPFPSKQPLLRYGGQDIRVVVPDTVHPGADGAPLVWADMGFTQQLKEVRHRQ